MKKFKEINIADIKALITDKYHTQEKYIITKRNEKFNDFKLHCDVLFASKLKAENKIDTWSFINKDNYKVEKIFITGCDIGEKISEQTTFVGLLIEDNNFKIFGANNYFGFYKIISFDGMRMTQSMDINWNKHTLFMTKTLFEKLFNITCKIHH